MQKVTKKDIENGILKIFLGAIISYLQSKCIDRNCVLRVYLGRI